MDFRDFLKRALFWVCSISHCVKSYDIRRSDYLALDWSGAHVLLVSLFGIPIVRSISHFFGRPNFFFVYQIFFCYTKYLFGRPNFFLVDQISFWYTKISFSYTKILFGQLNLFLVDQKNEKLTGQLVYQRDWPKVHGLRLKICVKI